VPFGLTYTEIDAWMKYGGGQELLDKIGAEFGIKACLAATPACRWAAGSTRKSNSPTTSKV
jgi:TRAP-type mannitol/chloroaromatic compound transport system substrate-binding protein